MRRSPNTPDRPRVWESWNTSQLSVLSSDLTVISPDLWCCMICLSPDSLCVAGYGHYLLFPNLIDYDIGGWLSTASVYLLSYVALSANQRPVLSGGDQWGGVFAVLWLLLCPMVIMWPDTTISDDRRAQAADWAQQVSAGWTRGLSKQSQRLEPSDELMQARTRQLPPAGKCSLDNTQTWPGLLISHWHPQWHTRAARQNISAVPRYISNPPLLKQLTFLPPRR